MNYSRQDILGIRMTAMMGLSKLTRNEFFSRLQIIRPVEESVARAFEISEAKIHAEQLDDEPHGQPWHVSFHASQFPGNNPMACPRQSLYRMMDFPEPAPMSRLLRQTADSGKAAETTLVEAWDRAEMLLSSPDPQNQTGFEYADAWLTGSVDAIVLFPGANMPTPVEIKERKNEVLQEMQLGRGPFPEHVSQVKVEIAFTRMAQSSGVLWADEGYDLCDHGHIYYVSRDNPLLTAEFRIDYDENFWVAGLEKLKRWRAYFEEDHLPELDPGKRSSKFGHPNGWRWSYAPCQWCQFKKSCQLDFQAGNTQLSKSIGVDRAKKIRPTYDPEKARKRVFDRWTRKREPASS